MKQQASRATDSRLIRVAVDIGGSFTDVVLTHGDKLFTIKTPTTPWAPEEGVNVGVREILAVAECRMADISIFILGTTLATNALIERKGAKTALLTTDGFRDVLEMGQENRFSQYDIFLKKPQPLVPRQLRFGVPERLDVHGRVHIALDEARVVALAHTLQEQAVESVAVSYLHSYVDARHEERTAELLARHAPSLWVTLSSEVCPEVREYERTSTACANAYVQPVVAGALQRLQAELRQAGLVCPLFLMTSSGAIATVETGIRQPVKLVESGPAGGAILAREIAQQCHARRALSFDMGGTTAKICFIDDYEPEVSRRFEFGRVHRFMKGSGLPIRIPVIEMVEIGAGGGSIAHLDTLNKIQVGPDSATSNPGPACFGRGGEFATVTDANCALGLLDAERFASGKVALSVDAARHAIERHIAQPLGMDATFGALAISEIVTENMANAARMHAAEQGKTIDDYTMIAFGGAAPLHAVHIASKLGVSRVVVPMSASVGSALGFLWAPIAYQALRTAYQRVSTLDEAFVGTLLDQMRDEVADAVSQATPEGADLGFKLVVYMRYAGQGHEIAVTLPMPDRGQPLKATLLLSNFESQYNALFGRTIDDQDVEIITWTVVGGSSPLPDQCRVEPVHGADTRRASQREVTFAQTMRTEMCRIEDRNGLSPDRLLSGPVLIQEDQTTNAVPPGYRVCVSPEGHLIIDKVTEEAR